MRASAVVLASGPSLCIEDVDYAASKATIYAVNDCYKMAPSADVIYAADGDWLDHHIDSLELLTGRIVTQDKAASAKHSIEYIESADEYGLSSDKNLIHRGGNSAYQAINLAYLHGFRHIFLLGCDMKFNRKSHWFGDHPYHLQKASPFGLFIEYFNVLASRMEGYGLEIINCSPDSALTCFKTQPIQYSL